MTAPRQRKQTRDELRAVLLDTGRTILQEEGLGTGAEALTFKRVFARVEKETGLRLTNASIIRRVWRNQADYQADVLVSIATDDGGIEFEYTESAVAAFLDGIDVSTPEARWRSVAELCRVAGAANVEALERSPNWTSWIGVWALATAGDPYVYRTRIEEALLDGYNDFTRKFVELYAGMAELLGLRLCEGLTLRQFAIAAESLAEGCALRNRVDPSDMSGIVRSSGPDGAQKEWTLFSVGLEALVREFFAIDPDWSPPTDRARPANLRSS
jgi:hypothetical protein